MSTINNSTNGLPTALLSSTSLNKLGVAGRPLSDILPMALEPRFMFDAAGAAVGLEAAAAQDVESEKQAQAEGERLAEALAREAEKSQQETEQEAAERAGMPGAIIVFVDRSVEGYEALLAGLDPRAEVIYFNSDQNGLSQMAMALEGRRDVIAVHILSHGGVGEVRLGGEVLNLESLGENKEALAVIRAALAEDADILLYGCNVSGGGEGRAFVEALAEALDADVAASDDLTGAQGWGGDWELETEIGAIETDVLFSEETRQAFDGVLKNIRYTEDKKTGVWTDNSYYPKFTNKGGKTTVTNQDVKLFEKVNILQHKSFVAIHHFKLVITGVKDGAKEGFTFSASDGTKTRDYSYSLKAGKTKKPFPLKWVTWSFSSKDLGNNKWEVTIGEHKGVVKAYYQSHRTRIQGLLNSLKYYNNGNSDTNVKIVLSGVDVRGPDHHKDGTMIGGKEVSHVRSLETPKSERITVNVQLNAAAYGDHDKGKKGDQKTRTLTTRNSDHFKTGIKLVTDKFILKNADDALAKTKTFKVMLWPGKDPKGKLYDSAISSADELWSDGTKLETGKYYEIGGEKWKVTRSGNAWTFTADKGGATRAETEALIKTLNLRNADKAGGTGKIDGGGHIKASLEVTDTKGKKGSHAWTAFEVDAVGPTVDSAKIFVPILAPIPSTYGAGDVLRFTVTFNEKVRAKTGDTVTLNIGGVDVTAKYVRGAGSKTLTFKIDSLPDGLEGSDGIKITSFTGVTDTAGNDAVANFDIGATWNIDTLGAEIESITSTTTNGVYGFGKTIEIVLTTTDDMDDDMIIIVTLDTGATVELERSANDAKKFTGTYTVGGSDKSKDLNVTAIAIKADIIQGIQISPSVPVDGDGNSFYTGVDRLNAKGQNLADQKDLIIDTSGPGVDKSATEGHNPGEATWYIDNGQLKVKITFAREVNLIGTATIQLKIGNQKVTATAKDQSGSDTLTFTVAAGDLPAGVEDGDGIEIEANSLMLAKTATLKDTYGNDANLAIEEIALSNVRVDTIDPSIDSATITKTVWHKKGDDLIVELAFSEEVTLTGTATLTLDFGGGKTKTVTITGSGTASDKLSFTTRLPDGLEMNKVKITRLALGSGATLLDKAGNTVDDLTAPKDSNNKAIEAAAKIDSKTPGIDGATIAKTAWHKKGDSLTVDLTFNEKVTLTGTATLTLDFGGGKTKTVTITGSGTASDKLSFTTRLPDGLEVDKVKITKLELGTNAALEDKAGNAVDGLDDPIEVAADIDTRVPTLNLAAAENDGWHRAGDELRIKLTFSENVTLSNGKPTITLDLGGGVMIKATYDSGGSGGKTLVFKTNKIPAGKDIDVTGIDIIGYNLNGAILKDKAGNVFDPSGLTSPNVAARIDTIAPTIDNVVDPPRMNTVTEGEDLEIKVAFSEEVTLRGTASIKVKIGERYFDATATGVSGKSLIFKVAAAQLQGLIDDDGVSIEKGTSIVLSSGGSLTDKAGNAVASLDVAETTLANQTVNATVPKEPGDDEIETVENTRTGVSIGEEIVEPKDTDITEITLTLKDGQKGSFYANGARIGDGTSSLRIIGINLKAQFDGKTLSLSRSDGGAFTSEQVKNITQAISFRPDRQGKTGVDIAYSRGPEGDRDQIGPRILSRVKVVDPPEEVVTRTTDNKTQEGGDSDPTEEPETVELTHQEIVRETVEEIRQTTVELEEISVPVIQETVDSIRESQIYRYAEITDQSGSLISEADLFREIETSAILSGFAQQKEELAIDQEKVDSGEFIELSEQEPDQQTEENKDQFIELQELFELMKKESNADQEEARPAREFDEQALSPLTISR